MTETHENNFLFNTWYFIGTSSEIHLGKMKRKVIAGQPLVVGRRKNGFIFALRDTCPHRAAPFSKGCIIKNTVECPYHGWRFDVDSGICKTIPSLTSDQNLKIERISVPTYITKEQDNLIWVYLANNSSTNKPRIQPYRLPFSTKKAIIDYSCILECNIDHAVIGLIDPAHGPYVHQQWWWRSPKKIKDKIKYFEPYLLGFTMKPHSPSSNSFAYKLLGGNPVTEIIFQIPGFRTEEIKIGKKTLLSITIVTPINADKTEIRQIFFTNLRIIKILSPILQMFTKKFIQQDANIIKLQQMGLAYNPKMMLIDDANTQAKWYYAIKKEWNDCNELGRKFKNPVKATTLKWRT